MAMLDPAEVAAAVVEEQRARLRDADNAYVVNAGLNMSPWPSVSVVEQAPVPPSVLRRGRRAGLGMTPIAQEVLAGVGALEAMQEENGAEAEGEQAGAVAMEEEVKSSSNSRQSEDHADAGKHQAQWNSGGSERTVIANKTRLDKKRKSACIQAPD